MWRNRSEDGQLNTGTPPYPSAQTHKTLHPFNYIPLVNLPYRSCIAGTMTAALWTVPSAQQACLLVFVRPCIDLCV